MKLSGHGEKYTRFEAKLKALVYNDTMTIRSAVFVRGIVREEDTIRDGIPQLLFIGRSNVGKSSVINSFTNKKDLAISSSTPGRTTQVNVFLINKNFYLVDLPGYGYARGSTQDRQRIADLISWYVFSEHVEMRRVVLIVDVEVGLTETDLHMIKLLNEDNAEYIVLANKVDKIKGNELSKSIKKIKEHTGNHMVIPYSAKKGKGLSELTKATLNGLSKVAKDDIPVELEMNRYPDIVIEEDEPLV